jgi:hypothetical protein
MTRRTAPAEAIEPIHKLSGNGAIIAPNTKPNKTAETIDIHQIGRGRFFPKKLLALANKIKTMTKVLSNGESMLYLHTIDHQIGK